MGGVYLILAVAVAAAAGGIIYYFFFYTSGSAYERALSLAKAGNYVDARGVVRSRLDRDEDDPIAHYYMSRVYATEGNEEMEAQHLKEIKRINRFTGDLKATDVLGRLAQIYYKKDRFADAFEVYLDVLDFEPTDESALAHVAFLAIGQGEYEIAERFFKRLVQKNGKTPEYRLARGVGLSMLKKPEAGEELNTALELDPDNQTALFLCAMQAFKDGDSERAAELIERFLPTVQDEYVGYVAHRLATAIHYLNGRYKDAVVSAEQCLATASKEDWEKEEYDARLAIAYMAMCDGDLEKSSEHLLELEIRNPSDDLVMRVSDFRMDVEEQVARLDEVSPRGFDFSAHMQDWLRNRFADDAIYRMSGLAQDVEFDVLRHFTRDGEARQKKPESSSVDPTEMIQKFNALKGDVFLNACNNIITALGFKVKKSLPYRDKDGADFQAVSLTDKKIQALFRIRQWVEQPISDIFLREQQNYMNELKVNQGFVVAGARLTSGAEAALKSLRSITVVNEMELGDLLKRVMQ